MGFEEDTDNGYCSWNEGVDLEEIADRLLNDLVITFQGKERW